ncbi:hypothetical protein [Nonomuraea sp. KM90]|uniref:hypothetical protein n=1 Tax=Nonomuraea sp. KM90 TaxID=3457428 RepID=UPI003FCC6921
MDESIRVALLQAESPWSDQRHSGGRSEAALVRTADLPRRAARTGHDRRLKRRRRSPVVLDNLDRIIDALQKDDEPAANEVSDAG